MPLTHSVVAACALLLAIPIFAQDPPPRVPGAPPPVQRAVFDTGGAGSGRAGTVPYFPLGSSALAITGPVRAGAFVSSAGRRALAMGPKMVASSSGRGPSSGCTTSSCISGCPSTRSPSPDTASRSV